MCRRNLAYSFQTAFEQQSNLFNPLFWTINSTCDGRKEKVFVAHLAFVLGRFYGKRKGNAVLQIAART